MEFSRTAITLGGLEIRWYGVLIVLGMALAVLLAMRREKRLRLPKDATIDLALICIPAAILCARLYYVAFSWEYYAENPMKIFSIREGGMAIYGGVLGGMLAGAIYSLKKRVNYWRLADLVAPSLALGQCVGRWGNFLNQEAYGASVKNAALAFFPNAVYIEGSGWHYATFFYESTWCLLIVAALLIFERRRAFKRVGDIFCWYVLLYALERAAVEGLRTDSLYLGALRVSQLLSLAAALAVLVWFTLRMKKRRALGAAACALALLAGIADVAIGNFAVSAVAYLGVIALAVCAYREIEPSPGDQAA